VGEPFKFGRIALADTPAEFQKIVGINRFSAATILIPDLHGAVLYIDVEPAAAPALAWKPEPAGDETTAGYSLSRDPLMRADELKLIDYARAHAATVYSVLANSASSRDRIAAAWIAGYAPQDKAQIAALLGAVTDPDSTVRNNSIRVLAVLAFHDPRIARRIPPDPFIPMLRSLSWTDRNKAFTLVGRIAGIPEERLQTLLASHNAAAILAALDPK
jgi:hypothetical protein